ncbi:MAG TPA: tRNA pseudouridine(13) synthase TruD, partial [Desulfuromonadales bacterium]|nr:tRNA pseudouridine(13) synthase TruD [Desulfuromonadales bacterium]
MPSLLTAKLPGTGGVIKETPDDFFVEELPLYLPCGEGEHLYLTVEKKGLTTFEMLQRLAAALGVRERDLGYAGLKDARATTRQTVSVAGISVERGLALKMDGMTVLSAKRHLNKLRLGHLAGNRFVIRLRHVVPDAFARAESVLAVLERNGVPNRFGRQRYGALGNSDRIGKALLRHDDRAVVAAVVGDPVEIRNERWRQAASQFAAGNLRRAFELMP